MPHKRGKKTTTKTGGTKKTKTTTAHRPSEGAGEESAVLESLAVIRQQIGEDVQRIRDEIDRFHAHVMEAFTRVRGEQAQGLAQVREAMEEVLHIATEPAGETEPRPAAEREEEPVDEPDDADTAAASPTRATATGVENVRLAVGHVARAIDEPAPTPELDRSIREGMAAVEKAVHQTMSPEADATHEGVESTRAAIADTASTHLPGTDTNIPSGNT